MTSLHLMFTNPRTHSLTHSLTFTRSIAKSAVRCSDLYPEVERLYEHVDGRVLLESDVPDQLDLGRVRRRHVHSIALQRHSHEVRDADDERDEVDDDD